MTDREPMDVEKLPEAGEILPQEKYRKRPVWQLILAWALIAVVLFAFFGVCYWMMNYRV